jgi:hypothetical protein
VVVDDDGALDVSATFVFDVDFDDEDKGGVKVHGAVFDNDHVNGNVNLNVDVDLRGYLVRTRSKRRAPVAS